MTEPRLRELRVPGEDAARARVEPLVLRAFDERERVPQPRRHFGRLVLGVAGLAVLAAALSPPGTAVLRSLRDAVVPERVVGVERGRPQLVRLPAEGQVLARSASGQWVVQQDGARRRLGRYADASWSPHGRFVVVARAHELAALTPAGAVRWALPSRAPVADPRWAPSGLRVAYRAGRDLHVVDGNGTDDRVVFRDVANVAPAWSPGERDVVAFAGSDGRVRALDAATGEILFRTPVAPVPAELGWTATGDLLVLGPSGLRTLRDGRVVARTAFGAKEPVALAPAPAGSGSAVIVYDPVLERSELLALSDGAARRVFSGAGRFGRVAWSPDGRWLLLAWPSADQWLFIRSTGVRELVAFSNLSEQFDGFPVPLGWCCPED